MNASIGGVLNLEALRNLHRPTNPAGLVAEARRLAATGLTARDVAQALRMPFPEVLESLHGVAR